MDRPTFEGILHDHLGLIRQTLTRCGVQPHDLDDTAQEVLRAALRGLPAFQPSRAATPEGAAIGWVSSICERQAANYHRKRRRRGEVLRDNNELDGVDSLSPDAEQCLLAREHTARVHQILSRLDPGRKAVVIAYALEETPMATVAINLGIPLGTAWNRWRLAREDIRAAYHRDPAHVSGARL